MILPALTEATSPHFRPIKYSLFPPLGLATLAAYLGPDVEVSIHDEHVERLRLDDEPDLVVIQAYITSARRSYEIADHFRRQGAYVVIGGLHPTSLPDEAAAHADTVFIGPGEDTWPQFLEDLAAGRPAPRYTSKVRTLVGLPPIRRDLIKRHLYLVPNSIVVSRGCPHKCDFCYKEAFFEGGRSFYTQIVDDALAEIDRLPGRHLYFLDDHLFGSGKFARELFAGMSGMGRLWQAAGTVKSVLQPGLLEAAVDAGLRSLFVGFETISAGQPDRTPQEPEPEQGLRRRRPSSPRPRRDGERQLRVRDGRRRPDRLRPDRRLGGQPGRRDRHVSRPDAVPVDRPVPADGRRGPAAAPRLGPLRHPPHRLPPSTHEPRAARGGVLAGVPGLLPLAQHRSGRRRPRRLDRRDPPRRLLRGLEEVRAGVGRPHPRPPGRPRPAGAGGGAVRPGAGPGRRRRSPRSNR